MKINLFGVGNYTEVMIELCRDCGYNQIDLHHYNESKTGEMLMGCKVFGTYDQFIETSNKTELVAVAIGDNKKRGEWLDKFRRLGFSTPNLIHPKAYVASSVVIGKANYIHANAFLWTKVRIANNCIVSPNAMIAHHTRISRNCLISANSMVGSYNKLGNNVLFGIGACSLSDANISIGNHSIIGANSLVTTTIEKNTVVVGSPAKELKKL